MNFNYLKKYIDKYKGQYILVVTIIILETLVDILNPAITAEIVDVGVKNRDLYYIRKMRTLSMETDNYKGNLSR